MKVAEYKQTGIRTESYTVTVPPEYDEEGNIISEEQKRFLQERMRVEA